MAERIKDKAMHPRISRLLSVFAILLLSSCDGTLFHRFREVKDTVWHNSDTLEFVYSGSRRECVADALFEVRCDASYPYRFLNVRIEVCRPSGGEPLMADTLCCEVYDMTGRRNGSTSGLLYQLSSNPLSLGTLASDSLLLRLVHIMNDTSLEGISDVGIKIVESSSPCQNQF